MKKQNESSLYHDFIRKAKTGDSEAFLSLYHLTYSSQFSIAFRVLENYHYAEDAVQEAYLAAWKDLPDLQDDALFFHWLNRITYHRALDILKIEKNTAPTPWTCSRNLSWNRSAAPHSRLWRISPSRKN